MPRGRPEAAGRPIDVATVIELAAAAVRRHSQRAWFAESTACVEDQLRTGAWFAESTAGLEDQLRTGAWFRVSF